jgi:hypothetical protein
MKLAAAVIASSAIATALVTAPAAGAATKHHRPASCTRGGAALEAAQGKVRIVRRARHVTRPTTRDEQLLTCWAPTGKRSLLVEELDIGDDLSTSSDVEVVDGRYAGVITEAAGGVTVSMSASVRDAKTGRLVHEADNCEEGAVLSGPADAAFLPHGGLAYTCDDGSLHVYRRAGSKTAELPEPLKGNRSLAVVRHSRSFGPVLYWTRADGTAGSLTL